MLCKLNPFVRFAGNVQIGTYFKDALAHDSRLFFCRKGEATLLINNLPYQIIPGTLIYIPQYTPYRFVMENGENVQLGVLNFDFTTDNSDVKRWQHINAERWDGNRHVEGYVPDFFKKHSVLTDVYGAERDIAKISLLFFNKDECYKDYSSAILKTLLLKIMTDKPLENERGAAAIIGYIREKYAEKLSCESIAKRFNYHPNHINRVIRQHTGKSLKSYIIYYRLRVAKDLLVSTNESLTAISLSCGFSTPSYFSETFIKHEGITPREYRNRTRTSVV